MRLLEFHCRHGYPTGLQIEVAFGLDRRFNVLFGPSGAGKTTVLSIIAGFVRPSEGHVSLGDRTLFDSESGTCLPPESRSIGFVFQDSLLFPHLTVEGNLRYGQRHRKAQRRSVDFARVVEVLEIGGLLDRNPSGLSGGEKQRVSLGRALLSGPELLLMDEPLASLDAALKSKVLAYLERAVAEWDIPTLLVTHSQAEVRRAADWVVVLDKGHVVATGTPDDALGQPESLAWGNSVAPANLLRLDHVETSEGRVTARLGGQVLLLPQMPSGTTPRFVQFSPTDVILSGRDVPGISARNQIRGRVCRIASTKDAVFVAVDIGQVIWVEVTPVAAGELNLEAGVEVVCLFETHSLSYVD